MRDNRNMKKINSLSLSLLLVLIVVVVIVAMGGDTSPTVARAGTGENVSGFAWANTPQSAGSPTTGTNQGVGWISFNNSSDGSSRVYGVNVDDSTRFNASPSNGNFSGYAWSENLGWISFAPQGPYPESPKYSARIDWSTGKVTGWARACAGSANPNTTCVGYNANVGGMDGWIKLSGTAQNGSRYGVNLNLTTNQFSGYAWGSKVIGWVDFSPSANAKVVVSASTPPPTPPTFPPPTSPTSKIKVSPTFINFSTVNTGSSKNRTVVVENKGTAKLTGLVSGLSAPFSCISGCSPYSLAPGKSQNITFEFSPQTSGNHNDIANFSGGGDTAVTLRGRGVVNTGGGGSTPPTSPPTATPPPTTQKPVIETFTVVNPVNSGDKTKIKWSSSNAVSCEKTAGPGFSTGGKKSGTDWSAPLSLNLSPIKFIIKCTNAGGSTSKLRQVIVNPVPVCGDGTCEQGETLLGCPSDCFRMIEF